ncbi:RNA polymerase factor sigma-32 [Rhodospirillaceae bacterium SYSU D60014]|jgi:RNA polymerase sigma-32 factor|uniref:RNA polymerase factor sigma-32 n=1 Tax=Virgifigura deserti TaxID=2268457 RepID=UPI000E665D0E
MTKSNVKFINTLMNEPFLTREQELELARRWREMGDQRSLHALVRAYMRLVVSIAARFRNYGLPMSDLIQEGNVGLMLAAARFEPEREVRFSTYAVWWIRCTMQDYILRNWSIVRTSTTPSQKLLFFNLRRLRARIEGAWATEELSEEGRTKIAAELKVKPSLVEEMGLKLSKSDTSLNAPINDASDGELQDFLVDNQPNPEDIVIATRAAERRSQWLAEALDELSPRERGILSKRRLCEDGATLDELGREFHITRERVRQLEQRAMKKLRESMRKRVEQHTDLFVEA